MKDSQARLNITQLKADVRGIDAGLLLVEGAVKDLAIDQVVLSECYRESASVHLQTLEALNLIIDRIEAIEEALRKTTMALSVVDDILRIHLLPDDKAPKGKNHKRPKAPEDFADWPFDRSDSLDDTTRPA